MNWSKKLNIMFNPLHRPTLTEIAQKKLEEHRAELAQSLNVISSHQLQVVLSESAIKALETWLAPEDNTKEPNEFPG